MHVEKSIDITLKIWEKDFSPFYENIKCFLSKIYENNVKYFIYN